MKSKLDILNDNLINLEYTRKKNEKIRHYEEMEFEDDEGQHAEGFAYEGEGCCCGEEEGQGCCCGECDIDNGEEYDDEDNEQYAKREEAQNKRYIEMQKKREEFISARKELATEKDRVCSEDDAIANVFSYVDVHEKMLNTEPTASGNKGNLELFEQLDKLIRMECKKNIIANQEMVVRLNAIEEDFPNFKSVIQYIKKRIMFQAIKGFPISLPAINLQGDSGIGKTHFSERLAEALETDNLSINVSQLSSAQELAGLSKQWADPSKGVLAMRIIEDTEYAQPVILMDELCKSPSRHGENQIYNVLLKVFDKNSAKKFKDDFLDISLDASKAIYISTTNNWDGLPSPVKSRITNFNIKAPSKDEMIIIVKSIYKEKLKELDCEKDFNANISDEAVNILAKADLRVVKTMVESAIMSSLIKHVAMKKKGKIKISKEDFEAENFHAKGKEKTIGFI